MFSQVWKVSLNFVLLFVLPEFSTESNGIRHNLPFADESFRRLESGENSDEVINQCCKREPNFITIGYGLNDNEIRVDIGQCKQTCDKPALKTLKRDDFDRYLKKYPDMDPVQIFLALQSRVTNANANPGNVNNDNNNNPSLPLDMDEVEEDRTDHRTSETIVLTSMSTSSSSCLASTCHPTSFRREKQFILGDHKEIDVIESCDCVKMPQTCQRTSRAVRIHVHTPYEKIVDIGECIGSCGDESPDLTCRSIRNHTVSVEGPNGAQCIGVIDECQCTGHCYRIREFLKVYDYSNVFAASEVINNSALISTSHEESSLLVTNETIFERNEVHLLPGIGLGGTNDEGNIVSSLVEQLEPLTKLIDIGRCGGSCLNGHATSKCLSWKNGTCSSSLYGGRSKCSPTKFVTHSYADKKGQSHDLLSVISCGCH